MEKACSWITTMPRRCQRRSPFPWQRSTHLWKLYGSYIDRESTIMDTISISSTSQTITCMNVCNQERLPCDRPVQSNSNMPDQLASCRCHLSVRFYQVQFALTHALLCLLTVQAGSLPRRSSALAQAKSPILNWYTVTLREVGVDRSYQTAAGGDQGYAEAGQEG